jgi:SPP1 family predicted phage head-tail adaptor
MPTKLKARDLDTLCQLKRRQETSDGMGGASIEWTELANLWASVRPMRGGEKFFAQQITPQAAYVLTIRNRSDLREADVIDAPLGRFDVKFIRWQPREPFLELECELEPVTAGAAS